LKRRNADTDDGQINRVLVRIDKDLKVMSLHAKAWTSMAKRDLLGHLF
jgi:hypothetical protein